MNSIEELADILADDSLFESFERDDRLFDTSRYGGTVQATAQASSRRRIKEDRSQYQELFRQVHQDLAQGYRRLVDVEISKDKPIKQGSFYVDKGVMLYVARIYDPNTGSERATSTNREHKVHTIYENGTENDIWLLSLVSSLYDKKRQGRIVTEKAGDEFELLGETFVTTGYIYVARYAGHDDRFKVIPNLYKIGFATDLHRRLANTEREATYLFAPVRLVRSYEIHSVNAQLVEKTIHHYLQAKQLKLSLLDARGEEIVPKEWFVVSLEEIDLVINRIMNNLQSDSH